MFSYDAVIMLQAFAALLFLLSLGVGVVINLFDDDVTEELLAYDPPKLPGGLGKQRMVAKVAIPVLLSGKSYSLIDAGVLVGDVNSNSISTLLGRATKNGLNLDRWDGYVVATQSNVGQAS